MSGISKIKNKTYNFLRWTEKWTKTDMVYLASGSFWITLGRLFSSISGLALAYIFANYLPKETYGTYKYVFSIFTILTIPTISGIESAITQAVSQGYEGSLVPAIKTRIRWGLLGGLASFLLGVYYLLIGNHTLAICFFITGLFVPFLDSLNTYIAFLNGQKDFKTITKYDSIIKIISALTSIAILFLVSKNIYILVFTFFISNTLLRFIFTTITIKKHQNNHNINPQTIGYGKHLSFMSIIMDATQQLDSVLLFNFLGPVQLAAYTLAISPVREVVGISGMGSIGQLVLPKLGEKSLAEIKTSLPSKMLKLFLFALPFVLFYILAAPTAYKIFFPQYMESVAYSQIFSLTILFMPQTLIVQTFIAHMRKKELYIMRIAIPIIKIVLFIILLPIYGAWGAIFSLVLLEIFRITILIYLFIKINKKRLQIKNKL